MVITCKIIHEYVTIEIEFKDWSCFDTSQVIMALSALEIDEEDYVLKSFYKLPLSVITSLCVQNYEDGCPEPDISHALSLMKNLRHLYFDTGNILKRPPFSMCILEKLTSLESFAVGGDTEFIYHNRCMNCVDAKCTKGCGKQWLYTCSLSGNCHNVKCNGWPSEYSVNRMFRCKCNYI